MNKTTDDREKNEALMFSQSLIHTLESEIRRLQEMIAPGSDANNRIAEITQNIRSLTENIKDFRKYFN
jgi:aconitase B